MITYNLNDFNLDKVSALNGTFNYLDTKLNYYVYGLTQTDNPTVVLSPTYDSKPSQEKIGQMVKWLEEHGLTVEREFDDKQSVRIGLRKDVRNEPKFAAALVRTMVAFFEGALALKPKFKLPKVQLRRSRWMKNGGSERLNSDEHYNSFYEEY